MGGGTAVQRRSNDRSWPWRTSPSDDRGGRTDAGHDHGGERGFSADYTELTLAANIDPTLRGYANIAFADDEVEVEEAWFQTLRLGQGLTVKGGRFRSGIGYQNERHPHAWEFADNSLMYSALFGDLVAAICRQAHCPVVMARLG